MQTFPNDISQFATWKSCFTFCMNQSKGQGVVTSLDGINGRSTQTLWRGENDSKQSDEFQASFWPAHNQYVLLYICWFLTY